MTQTTITTTTQTTITTIVLAFCTALVLRCVARRDMPEYGLLEGQVFYMARSSKNDGTYYLLTWDYERIRWNCSCPATTNNCRHHRAVKADCAKSHTVQGYTPASKAEKFEALWQRFDIRAQTSTIAATAALVEQALQVASNETDSKARFAVEQARETLSFAKFLRSGGPDYCEAAEKQEAWAMAILNAPANEAYALWKDNGEQPAAVVEQPVIGANGRPMERRPDGALVLMR